jgi:hypothetical protein
VKSLHRSEETEALPTTGFPLILAATTKDQFRWARQHLYFLLVLGPIVLSATYLIVTSLADRGTGFDLPIPASLVVMTAAQAALVALSLSRASSEIFHIRRPEGFLESMPVTLDMHLYVAVGSRILRTAFAAALVLIARWLIGGSGSLSAVVFTSAAVWTLITAISETWGALNWIHWSHKKGPVIAATALLTMLVSVSLGGILFLLTTLNPQGFQGFTRWWVNVAGVAWTAAVYLMLRESHRRWRSGDVEFAQRLQPLARWSLSANRFTRRLGPIVSALLVRDLQLTVRGFSSAVYVTIGLAALWMLALAAVLASRVVALDPHTGFDVPLFPESMAIKVACVLATASLAALTLLLVAYEVPTLWLERAVGAAGLDICRAKIWYARIVSLPALMATSVVAGGAGAAPLSEMARLIAECMLLWWLVSSFIGVLSFETPARPGIAMLTVVSIATAVGLVSASLWPFGAIIYVFTFGSLLNRARERARYFLITGDD